jgi:hypothetical protein
MPPEQDDRNARQLEALRRYVAERGTEREDSAAETRRQRLLPKLSRSSLPLLLLTVLLVAAALTGGILIGGARDADRNAPAAGSPGLGAITTISRRVAGPVASPECKTAVDRANRSLATAVRVERILREYTQVINDLQDGKISSDEAVRKATPGLVVGSIEAGKFDSALSDYQQIVDKCKLQAP